MAISKFNYNSFNVTPVAGNALSFNSDADGFSTAGASSMVLIKTLTASSSATLSFVHGSSDVVFDSTYPVYLFKFINIHPATDSAIFQVGFRDGSTAYDAPKTSTFFYASHKEDGSQSVLAYETSYDQAQSTSFQNFNNTGNANDENVSGDLQIFNPSSTTFVKHFISRHITEGPTEQMGDAFIAGYCNTTTAIDGVQFKFSSGNIDAGVIKLYGIADS